MSIGILTYHSSDNYGSVLQAYALCKYINKFSKCEIIDYRKKEVKELYRIFKPMNTRYNILTNIYNFLYCDKLLRRKKVFEDFRKSELLLSASRYSTKDELEKNINNYSALISGSDQVWNFDIVDFDTSYMLDFPGYLGKRFSYAASMGPKAKPLSEIEKYTPLLKNFDGITLREDSAAKLTEQITGMSAPIVIDPVFLLDKSEWDSICNKSEVNTNKDYIFCYFPGTVSKSMEKFSKELAKKHNCKRILVMHEWRNLFRSGKKQYDCSPWDFLKLIRDAKYVCTTSFHGTAFSLIMNVPFYVEMGGNTNDFRISTLLSSLGKTESIINAKQASLSAVPKAAEMVKNSKKILDSMLKLAEE